MGTDTKEMYIMKANTEGAVSAGIMEELKQRLEELQELLEERYISESEYSAARANILMELGVDITTRPRAADPRRMQRLEVHSRKKAAKRSNSRYFWITTCLIVGGLGCAALLFWALSGSSLFRPQRDSSASLLPLPSAMAREPASPSWLDIFEDEDSEESLSGGSVSEDSGGSASGGSAPSEMSASADMTASTETARAAEGAENISAEEPAITEAPQAAGSESETAILGWGVVSARRVKVRAAPDMTTEDNVLGWAAKGERFAILGEDPGQDGSKWYNVRHEKIGRESWIKASMMTTEF